MDVISAWELLAAYERQGVISQFVPRGNNRNAIILCQPEGLQVIATDAGATIERLETGALNAPGYYWGFIQGKGCSFHGLCRDAE